MLVVEVKTILIKRRSPRSKISSEGGSRSNSSKNKKNNGSSIKFVVWKHNNLTCPYLCVDLKRPTSEGLETGPALFTPAEIDRLTREKITPRRYLIATKQDVKAHDIEAGSKYVG